MDEKNFFEEFIKNFGKEMKNMGHANLIIMAQLSRQKFDVFIMN